MHLSNVDKLQLMHLSFKLFVNVFILYFIILMLYSVLLYAQVYTCDLTEIIKFSTYMHIL